MRFRIVGVLACIAALLLSAESLLAERDVPLACCSGLPDCGGRLCCDFDPTTAPPCSVDQAGFCMSICIWPATRISDGE